MQHREKKQASRAACRPSFNPAISRAEDGQRLVSARDEEVMGGGVQGFVGPTAVCGCVYVCVSDALFRSWILMFSCNLKSHERVG